jgi:uncharacterized damage-inducible protein DinB
MKETILKDLVKSKVYTLQVAEAMPEKDYEFKPTASVRNYMELMHHVAYSLMWMQDNFVLGVKSEWAPPQLPPTKDELIAYLTQSFDKIEKDLQSKKFTDENISGFYFMLEHNAHHRGQAVTYLRCCNNTPPEFPF